MNMKTKNLLILILGVAIAYTSCKKEEPKEPSTPTTTTFTIEGSWTREKREIVNQHGQVTYADTAKRTYDFQIVNNIVKEVIVSGNYQYTHDIVMYAMDSVKITFNYSKPHTTVFEIKEIASGIIELQDNRLDTTSYKHIYPETWRLIR